MPESTEHQIQDIITHLGHKSLKLLPHPKHPEPLEVFHILKPKHGSSRRTLNKRIISPSHLSEFLKQVKTTKQQRQHLNVESELQIVHIPHEERLPKASSENICELFQAFDINPSLLHPIMANTNGFLHLDYNSHHGKVFHNYFIGIVFYKVIWSYDPDTKDTHAIFLSNPGRKKDGHPEMKTFLDQLAQEASDLAWEDLILYVVLIQSLNGIDIKLRNRHTEILTVESETEFGPWKKLTKQTLELENITRLSRTMATCFLSLSNYNRQIQISKEMLDFARVKIKSRGADHSVTIKYLMAQADHQEWTTKYMAERVNNQISVLFTLAQHEDANANLNLSYSMKAIAVLTMFFLPATFFASLFAIPTLQWDQKFVIGERFWIYWVFTIPSTIFVILIWVAMRQWKRIKEKSGRVLPKWTSKSKSTR